jgi:(2S)-methylsuccinyl-CoA dehydrogenase
LVDLNTRAAALDQLLHHAARTADDHPTGRLTRQLAELYTAETAAHSFRSLRFREAEFGLEPSAVASLTDDAAVSTYVEERLSESTYQRIAALIDQTGGVGLDGLKDEQSAVQAAFRRFAQEKVAPQAEYIHRHDGLLPEEILDELAEMGCFGLSIPARYGGFQDDADPEHISMVIVSDELSRASFGTAGSLITRPELLSKALLKGGTEAQRRKWLPRIASGERQVAVAVTEPDFGSDVANLTTMARRVAGGWRLNGTKMWCTYAGRAEALMVLARTDPDMAKGHRGLSLFIVEKPPDYGHQFEHRVNGGCISGRAIATLGYRGMHSFEVVFEDYFVPDDNLIGGEAGLGQGFYMQMHGFAGSRLQTAGRALGIMAAAFAAGLDYARQRQVFGRPLFSYPLTQVKLVRMAMLIQAARQLTYFAAREIDHGRGAEAAAMAKLLTARAAESITRESQQLHGGMGYAEEFPISRHFVDARVLAIFEGAEEVLALRVIARAMLR